MCSCLCCLPSPSRDPTFSLKVIFKLPSEVSFDQCWPKHIVSCSWLTCLGFGTKNCISFFNDKEIPRTFTTCSEVNGFPKRRSAGLSFTAPSEATSVGPAQRRVLEFCNYDQNYKIWKLRGRTSLCVSVSSPVKLKWKQHSVLEFWGLEWICSREELSSWPVVCTENISCYCCWSHRTESTAG